MQSKRVLLIEALKKLYRKRISIENYQGITIRKDKAGNFMLVDIGKNMFTLMHIVSGKKSYYFVDVLQIDLPKQNYFNQMQKSQTPYHP